MAPLQPIILIPLDSRPVCYQMPRYLAKLAGVELIVPPPSLLGELKRPAPLDELYQWWVQSLNTYPNAAVIMALDTLAYGGLIAGRVNVENYNTLENRVQKFFNALKDTHRPRYGFSTILRIPNYNNAEEEPDYWAQYGAQLYRYSALFHQTGKAPEHLEIPNEVVADFINRRRKNFALNQSYLDHLEAENLDYLAFGQDDTGRYGLNVQEARDLLASIRKMGLAQKAHVQTGADELASLMIAKVVWDRQGEPLSIAPVYFPELGQNTHALFDGIPIGHVVERQIHTLGAHLVESPEEADLVLVCHTPLGEMGDHCAGKQAQRNKFDIGHLAEFITDWLPEKPVALADVAFANGADPWLMDTLVEKNIDLARLTAYAGWNTPGNTIGTALAMGSLVYWATQSNCLDDTTRRQLLFIRLLDDWRYQAVTRQVIREKGDTLPSPDELKALLSEGINLLESRLNLPQLDPSVNFPCNRTFEINVDLGVLDDSHSHKCTKSLG